MYRCRECGNVFETPANYSEDKTPGGAFEGGSFVEHYTGCPSCGGNYEEAKECDGCGEFFCESQLYAYSDEDVCGEFCQFCMDEMEGVDDL